MKLIPFIMIEGILGVVLVLAHGRFRSKIGETALWIITTIVVVTMLVLALQACGIMDEVRNLTVPRA